MGASEAILEDDGSLYELAASVVGAAAAAGLTVGCAESCTGGLVCGCLTAVSGSSSAVRGSVVSYAIPVKHEVLGVSNEDVLEVEGLGAVSAECAAQMAEGARRVLGCDVAVSVTGIAGPQGEEPGKPVGTVWFGLAAPKGTLTRSDLFPGGRAEVRRAACERALRLLYEGIVETRA